MNESYIFWKENLDITKLNLRKPISDDESIEILSFFTLPRTYDDVLLDKNLKKITFIQNKIDYLVNVDEYLLSIPVEHSSRHFEHEPHESETPFNSSPSISTSQTISAKKK